MLRLHKALLAVFCLVICATMAIAQDLGEGKKDNKDDKKVAKIIRLIPTALAPNATGIIRIEFSAKKEGDPQQQFELIGVNLGKGNGYKIVIDGNEVTSREAKAGKGQAEAVVIVEFSSKKKEGGKKGGFGDGLPAALDPVTKIKHVEVRDANNQVILIGDFSE